MLVANSLLVAVVGSAFAALGRSAEAVVTTLAASVFGCVLTANWFFMNRRGWNVHDEWLCGLEEAGRGVPNNSHDRFQKLRMGKGVRTRTLSFVLYGRLVLLGFSHLPDRWSRPVSG